MAQTLPKCDHESDKYYIQKIDPHYYQFSEVGYSYFKHAGRVKALELASRIESDEAKKNVF